MKKVIITGATGAIGIALVQQLIEESVYVTVVCHRGSNRTKRIPKSHYVDVIECDLEEIPKIQDMVSDRYDVMYHLAWANTFGEGRNDIYSQMRNIQYTLDAVETAAHLGCRKFIGTGSQAEYGRYEGKLTGSTATFPENGYGIAKLCAGQLSRIRCGQLGMEHVWTRILSVYGPCDGSGTMISSVISQMLQGKKASCTLGEQMWDYLYAADAGRALFLLGKCGIHGKTYCIGSGKARPLREYIELIRSQIDEKLEIGFGEIPYSEKQVMYLCADIGELTKDTGFEPQYTFEQGIAETINWLKKETCI